MHLEPRDRAFIEESFRLLAADSHGAAVCFYQHLFAISPDARALFVIDTERQGSKMASTLAVIVNLIGNWGLLRGIVEDLALRHTAYGVTTAHYEIGGQALQAMLRDRLGPRWSPDIAVAWAKAYGAIMAAMVHAANRAAVEADDQVEDHSARRLLGLR